MIWVLRFVAALGLMAWAATGSANMTLAKGLCSADETSYISCRIKRSAKLLALCGRDLGVVSGHGYLQYRFGRSGRPEFVFPTDPSGSTGAFLFADYARAGVSRVEIRFASGSAEYTVFEYFEYDRWRSGVRVVTSGSAAKEVELVCAGTQPSLLGKLKGLLACDRESGLTGGCQ